jgi:hypothetical protein
LVGLSNCCWPRPAQSFLSSVSSRSMTKIFLLFSPRHVGVSKWGLLFDEGGVGLFVYALCLLHCSFSTSISALSRRPIHYGLCIFCHSVVGIATSYGLDDQGVGVRVPVGSRIFSPPNRLDRFWGPPIPGVGNLLSWKSKKLQFTKFQSF